MNARLPATTVRSDQALARYARATELWRCCELAESDPARAAKLLPAEIREALPAIVAGARAALTPAADEPLVNALTATVALVGFHGSEASKGEWIAAAVVRLQELPGDLVFEALADAEKSVRGANAVLAHVFTYVETYPARRRERLAKLLVLSEAVG